MFKHEVFLTAYPASCVFGLMGLVVVSGAPVQASVECNIHGNRRHLAEGKLRGISKGWPNSRHLPFPHTLADSLHNHCLFARWYNVNTIMQLTRKPPHAKARKSRCRYLDIRASKDSYLPFSAVKRPMNLSSLTAIS